MKREGEYVRVAKSLLMALAGLIVGALLATSICLMSFDTHRFRWWTWGIIASLVGMVVILVVTLDD